MNLAWNADLIGLVVATLLTLCVFSYLLGDNFLYRLAVAILTGGGAAYLLAIALWNIIVPRVLVQGLAGRESDPVGWTFTLIGLLLGALIIFKWFQRWAWVGNFSMAYLIGVGAGVAIGGVALGTLFTQSQAAARGQGALIPVIDSLIMLAVTVSVLISFTFVVGQRRGWAGLYTRLVQGVSTFGRAVLAIAFGVMLATVYIASVSVLLSRVQFIADAIEQLSRALF